MTPTDLAAALRTIAMAHPCWASVLTEAADRLAGGAERARNSRVQRAHGVRTGCAQNAAGGGEGGVGSAPSNLRLDAENQDSIPETAPSLSLSLTQTSAQRAHPVRTVEPATDKRSRGWTPGFTRFHDSYPEGYRDQTCARLWVTMGLEPETTRILAGLELWKGCEQWVAGQFVLAMRNFLDRRTWEQSPPPPKSKPKAGPVGGTLDKWAGVKGGSVNG